MSKVIHEHDHDHQRHADDGGRVPDHHEPAAGTGRAATPAADPDSPQWVDGYLRQVNTDQYGPVLAVVLQPHDELLKDRREHVQAGKDHLPDSLKAAVAAFFATGRGVRLRQLEQRHHQAAELAEKARLAADAAERRWKVAFVEGTDAAGPLAEKNARDAEHKDAETAQRVLGEAVAAERIIAREALAKELAAATERFDREHKAAADAVETTRGLLRTALTIPLIDHIRATARRDGMTEARTYTRATVADVLRAAFDPPAPTHQPVS